MRESLLKYSSFIAQLKHCQYEYGIYTDLNLWNQYIPLKAHVHRWKWKYKYGSELIEFAIVEYSIQGSHVQCSMSKRRKVKPRSKGGNNMLCVSITTSFKYSISNINAFGCVFNYACVYLLIPLKYIFCRSHASFTVVLGGLGGGWDFC